jgi:hypothetical protein
MGFEGNVFEGQNEQGALYQKLIRHQRNDKNLLKKKGTKQCI